MACDARATYSDCPAAKARLRCPTPRFATSSPASNRAGRLVRVDGAGLARAGDDRDPDPAARREGPGGAVRERRSAPTARARHAGAGQPVRHGQARRHGAWTASPHQLREVGETLAFLRQPEPPRRLARGARHAAAAARPCMAMKPQDGRQRAVPGDRAAPATTSISRKLPIQTCWPGEPAPLITWPLVVTKGPGDAPRGRLQSRHLPHAGDRARTQTIMRWLKHRGGAQHHRRWGKAKREPLPGCAVIGADPGTILAAVTPVPDTLSEYQFAGLLRGTQGRAGRLQDRAAEGAGRGRDRARGPCRARRVRRRRPLRRPHRLLQLGREVPGLHASRAITMRQEPDLSVHLHRPAARRALACWARR